MTFARIAMISLLCNKGLINSQSNPGRVDFEHFFDHKIKVDYSSCEHVFYDYNEYENEGDEYGYYVDDSCKR